MFVMIFVTIAKIFTRKECIELLKPQIELNIMNYTNEEYFSKFFLILLTR